MPITNAGVVKMVTLTAFTDEVTLVTLTMTQQKTRGHQSLKGKQRVNEEKKKAMYALFGSQTTILR